MASTTLKITSVPAGEAPAWVREQWGCPCLLRSRVLTHTSASRQVSCPGLQAVSGDSLLFYLESIAVNLAISSNRLLPFRLLRNPALRQPTGGDRMQRICSSPGSTFSFRRARPKWSQGRRDISIGPRLVRQPQSRSRP